MNRKADLIAIPGLAITLLLAIVSSIPVKAFVKNHTEALGPLSSSAGMLASFVVFLLVFLVFLVPVVLVGKHYQKRKNVPSVKPAKQVTYGYHTPVPR